MNKLLITLPILLLLAVGILFIKNPQDIAQISQSVTYGQWSNCTQANYLKKHDCQTSQSFLSTRAAFSNITYHLSKYSSSDCKKYWDYIYGSIYEAPINKNNYFENCYLSEQAKEIAKTDYCFETTYYIPDYIECTGL